MTALMFSWRVPAAVPLTVTAERKVRSRALASAREPMALKASWSVLQLLLVAQADSYKTWFSVKVLLRLTKKKNGGAELRRIEL